MMEGTIAVLVAQLADTACHPVAWTSGIVPILVMVKERTKSCIRFIDPTCHIYMAIGSLVKQNTVLGLPHKGHHMRFND